MHIKDHARAEGWFRRHAAAPSSKGAWKAFVARNNRAQEPRNMAEGGPLVGTPTEEVTQFDRRIYETPEGEQVSEKSTTLFFNGNWINIPSIHEGRSFTNDQLRFMIKEGKIEPTSVHGSRIEAEEAAGQRSDMMKRHVKGFAEGQLVQPNVDGSRPGYQGPGRPPKKLTAPQIMERTAAKKWFNKNIKDQKYTDKAKTKKNLYYKKDFDTLSSDYKRSLISSHGRSLTMDKVPKGYVLLSEWAKKNKIPAYEEVQFSRKSGKRYVSGRDYLTKALTSTKPHQKENRAYKYIIDKLDAKKLNTSGGSIIGGPESRTPRYYIKPEKNTLKDVTDWLNESTLNEKTMKNVDNLLKNDELVKLLKAGDYKNIVKYMETLPGNMNFKATTLTRMAQVMGGTQFRGFRPDLKINEASAEKIFEGLRSAQWGNPFNSGFRRLVKDTIQKKIGKEYFTKSYSSFAKDARTALEKDFGKKFMKNLDINEITGMTSGFRGGTYNSTQFVNLLDKNFNKAEHANMIKYYGQAESKIAEALKKGNRYKANKLINEWDTWSKNWYEGLDLKHQTQAMKDTLPTFKVGADPYGKIFSKERLAKLMDLDFNPRGDYITNQKLQLAKTFKTQGQASILKEVAMGNKDALKFLNTAAKDMQANLSPRSIAQLAKEHDCGTKGKGGSIMSCLQGKFKADPEKFLKKSAPLAKNNVNLYKWFKNGRRIARGTGIALAWEAAFAPLIVGWGKLEGDSNQRIIHDLAYGSILEGVGVPPEYVPGQNPKEEFMEAGGDELSYKMKRMGELEEQELPYLQQQRNDVINKMSNVEGTSAHQLFIEDDIKEKELELQELYNTPEFYEGPAGGASTEGEYGYNQSAIQDAFDLEQQTTAKIAADTAERKKATFDWLREKKLIANQNWQSQVPKAEGGIMSLKKK